MKQLTLTALVLLLSLITLAQAAKDDMKVMEVVISGSSPTTPSIEYGKAASQTFPDAQKQPRPKEMRGQHKKFTKQAVRRHHRMKTSGSAYPRR